MKRGKKAAALAVAAACIFAGACGKKTPKEEIVAYMPDGAPALALATLLAEDTAEDGVTYRVVNTAQEMTPLLSKLTNKDEDENAELCVLPVTAASKLLGSGERYRMLGLVTQGNLYLVSKATVTYGRENIAELLGKTVIVNKINEVPGMTLKAALTRNGTAWSLFEGGEPASDRVNIAAAADSFDMELLAEPAVSKRLGQNKGWQVVGDLQELYGGESGKGYPQAVIVAKSAFLEENGEWVRGFLEKLEAADEWLYAASAEEIYDAVTAHFEDAAKAPAFDKDSLGLATRERCGVRFAYAKDCRNAVEEYLSEVGFALPSEAFYYTGN